MRAWAKDHPRRVFRNAYHDTRAEGWTVNHKKIQRLWREEGLRVPQRRRRKRLGTTTTRTLPVADAPNRVWAVDFQFDATTDGRPIKIASIVDEHTRECLGGLVARNITGDDLIDELDRLSQQRCYPTVLRCHNGPELACAAMADWAREPIGLHFIPPGEPWRNGYVESFNARIRDECLDINIFGPRAGQGRHQRLGGRLQPPTPAQLARLPTPSGLRCWLLPPMKIDSHARWINSRFPARPTRPRERTVMPLVARF
jgi:putative transposase